MGPRQAQEGVGAHPGTRAQWGQNPSNEGAGPLVDLLGHSFQEDKASPGLSGEGLLQVALPAMGGGGAKAAYSPLRWGGLSHVPIVLKVISPNLSLDSR